MLDQDCDAIMSLLVPNSLNAILSLPTVIQRKPHSMALLSSIPLETPAPQKDTVAQNWS